MKNAKSTEEAFVLPNAWVSFSDVRVKICSSGEHWQTTCVHCQPN